MSYLKIALFLSMLLMTASGFANTSSNQELSCSRCYIHAIPDDWILVNIDGKWWWVQYNSDGSVNVKIPADF